MTKRILCSAGLALCVAGSVGAQATVERRVSGAPAGNVTFHFASRADVCGDGRTYIRADDMWMGSFNDGVRSMECERGPIRVLLIRDGSEIIRITTYAGPVAEEPGATNLGAVPAADAAAWLLGIAARIDGRPGREAIMPAALADSALVTRDLLAIARNTDRSRELRRSALSWIVRRRGERGELSIDEVARTLVTIARDENEVRSVRDQALSSLSRLESAASLDALVAMTTGTTEAWLARRAVEVMASSGDPRAREHLRTAAENGNLPEEARAAAITGLAGSYATSRDAEFLRGLYGRVNTTRLQDAIMTGIASIGGRASREWIVGIARNPDASIQQRKRAVSLGDRLGLSAADLSALYDAIPENDVRATLISQLATNGTRVAQDKLISIARNDPLLSNRRRAIQALGRFDDPRVKEALRDLISKG
ncbi:MAG TPA: HEAT repeat domain-containing protein [Gemmatimonadaceae bacterium]